MLNHLTNDSFKLLRPFDCWVIEQIRNHASFTDIHSYLVRQIATKENYSEVIRYVDDYLYEVHGIEFEEDELPSKFDLIGPLY